MWRLAVLSLALCACSSDAPSASVSHQPPPPPPPPPAPPPEWTDVALASTPGDLFVGVDPRGHIFCLDRLAGGPGGGPECVDHQGVEYAVSTLYDIDAEGHFTGYRLPDLEIFEIRQCGSERRVPHDPERTLRRVFPEIAAYTIVNRADFPNVGWSACADPRISLRLRGPIQHEMQGDRHILLAPPAPNPSVSIVVNEREVYTELLRELVPECVEHEPRVLAISISCRDDVAVFHSVLESPRFQDCLQWGPGPPRGNECAPDRRHGGRLLRIDLASGAITDLHAN
jgi:hypothetical protein